MAGLRRAGRPLISVGVGTGMARTSIRPIVIRTTGGSAGPACRSRRGSGMGLGTRAAAGRIGAAGAVVRSDRTGAAVGGGVLDGTRGIAGARSTSARGIGSSVCTTFGARAGAGEASGSGRAAGGGCATKCAGASTVVRIGTRRGGSDRSTGSSARAARGSAASSRRSGERAGAGGVRRRSDSTGGGAVTRSRRSATRTAAGVSRRFWSRSAEPARTREGRSSAGAVSSTGGPTTGAGTSTRPTGSKIDDSRGRTPASSPSTLCSSRAR